MAYTLETASLYRTAGLFFKKLTEKKLYDNDKLLKELQASKKRNNSKKDEALLPVKTV